MDDLATRVTELLDAFSADDARVADLLCDRYPSDAVAFTVVGEDLAVRDLTYGELRDLSTQSARALASLGVGSGDRVATLMGKGVDLVSVLLGIWRLGAVYVPLFTAFGAQAIASRLAGSATKVVITDAQQRSKLAPGPDMPSDRPWLTLVAAGGAQSGEYDLDTLRQAAAAAPLPDAPTGGDRPLVHMFTSGTTGAPKGVVHPVRHIAAWQSYLEHGLGVTANDVYWCAADPGWAYGLYAAIVAPLAAGRRSVLLAQRFDAASTWSVLTRLGVTNFAAAPTVYRALRTSASVPEAVQLRCASSAGEPLTPEVSEWAEQALGVPVYDHYGQTELGMVVANSWHPGLSRRPKPGSMGRSLPAFQVAVLGDEQDVPVGPDVQGRIAVDLARSPLVTFDGYHGGQSADKFTPDGKWYLTGDLGRMDADGDIFFASRDDDVILMAGYRIGPFDVESVILQHPSVAECAAVGVADPDRGEVLVAYVVLQSAAFASAELADDLQRWVKERYAAHAYPRAVHFIDALPKTPSGKIQRNVLRRQPRPASGTAKVSS